MSKKSNSKKTVIGLSLGLGLPLAVTLAGCIAMSIKLSQHSASTDDTGGSGPSMTLCGGTDADLSSSSDYVDFVINEPVDKTTGNRKNNGHSMYFNTTNVDVSIVKKWFKEYDPTLDPSTDPDDYKNLWPKFGFYYDETTDLWHFKFRLTTNPSESTVCLLTLSLWVNDESYTLPTQHLYFFPADSEPSVVQGSVKNYKLTFDKDNISNYTLSSLATSLMATSTRTDNPGSTYPIRWSSWMIDCFGYDGLESNLFAFLCVAEAYNFAKYCFSVADQTNDGYGAVYYPVYKDGKFSTKVEDGATKVGVDDLSNLSVTVNIQDVSLISDDDTNFSCNCTTVLKINGNQVPALASYLLPDDSSLNTPPLMVSERIATEDEASMSITKYGTFNDFSVVMNGDFQASVIDYADYSLANFFNYITCARIIKDLTHVPCVDNVGMKELLMSVFPNIPVDDINPDSTIEW